jgi:hypothetical protein
MGEMVRVAALSLVLAGCLSTPPKVSSEDAGAIDAAVPDATQSVCGRDPRPAVACNARGDFVALDYAPPVTAEIRKPLIDDVNADGAADLLLVDNDPGAPGIWILLGPIDAAAPKYHAFVPTGIQMGDAEVRQLLDDGSCPDLTVFGSTGTTGIAQIWRYDGGADMFAATPLTRLVDFDPNVANGPVTLEWARLRPIGDDLLVSDLVVMRVLRVGGDAESFSLAGVETAYAGDGLNVWTDVNGISAVRTAGCETDRVLVEEQLHGKWLYQRESALVAGAPFDWQGVGNYSRGTQRVDLDGVPPDDVFATGTGNFGAYLLSYAGDDEIALSMVTANSGYDPPDDFQTEGFAIGDLGGSPDPEYVALDRQQEPTSFVPKLVMTDSVRVTPAPAPMLLADQNRVVDAPDGFFPFSVVIADLSETVAGNEAWFIAEHGDLRCFEKSPATQTLVLCD